MKPMSRASLAVVAVMLLAAPTPAYAAAKGSVVINEIAWMGTTASTSAEWVELHNTTGASISLSGWRLKARDGTPSINLTGSIPAYGFFLLERSSDATVPGVAASQIYAGAMSNSGEYLELKDNANALIDEAPQWYAGNNTTKATMSRVDPYKDGNISSNWRNGTASYVGGLGTPKTANLPGGGSSSWYSVYFTDNLNTVMPDYGPKTMANALIAAINGASSTIEFAVYGFNGSEEILDALYAAADRGIVVRGVVDSYASGSYPYRDSEKVIARLGTVGQDNDDRIMHNKFFVIDGRWVWTGSTNITRNEVDAEYFGDISILIDHAALAGAYQTEFEEMYGGLYHDAKSDNTPHTFPQLSDGSLIESYFAPTDDALHNAMIKAIDKATAKIDVRTFYLTNQEIVDALLAAKTRGAAVRVILDADGAANEYSLHASLRSGGIQVKVENWGGTEHNKTLAADGYIVVLGSQNFTTSGNTSSDENCLYLENRPLAAAFGSQFETAWAAIPSQWLTANPGAESADSPGSLSDLIDNDHDDLTDEGAAASINTVQSGAGAMNVYFLRQAVASGASLGNLANYNVNLENKLVERLNAASSTIDVATYELTLPAVVDALAAKAAAGVRVRFIADAKEELDDQGQIDSSFEKARLYYERLIRAGVAFFADSPVFAVEDAAKRTAAGLPASPADRFTYLTITVGSSSKSGYLLGDAEYKTSTPTYYSRSDQMHNKFMVIDGTWVATGSWNFTINDTYGSDANRAAGILSGNTNHLIEMNSPELADAYRIEFEEMWGASGAAPNQAASNFHSRKTDNTPHVFTVGGRTVKLYFSPGDDAMPNMTQAISNEAQVSAHFSVFSWSDQGLVDALKVLYEGSALDNQGTLTGFKVQGVFEGTFWNQYWSASIDMTGRQVAGYESYSTRWANPAPVFRGREDKFLHHKYMILDVNSASDPFVVTGSTNWSANGNSVNDENMLVIYDAPIANQFYQEFAARYFMAGGIVDFLKN